MIDACFASDGRMVTRSREIRGRVALAAMLDRFLSDREPPRSREKPYLGAQAGGNSNPRYDVPPPDAFATVAGEARLLDGRSRS